MSRYVMYTLGLMLDELLPFVGTQVPGVSE